jgi:hypothetical protein
MNAQTKRRIVGGDIPTVWGDCAHCGTKVLRGPKGAALKAQRPIFCSALCFELRKRAKPKLEVVKPAAKPKRRSEPALEDL